MNERPQNLQSEHRQLSEKVAAGRWKVSTCRTGVIEFHLLMQFVPIFQERKVIHGVRQIEKVGLQFARD